MYLYNSYIHVNCSSKCSSTKTNKNCAKTPQKFKKKVILALHDTSIKNNITIP